MIYRMSKKSNKDYVLPEAGTDINLLKNKSIFVDDFVDDETTETIILSSGIVDEKKPSYPPHVYILTDMVTQHVPYIKYNDNSGRQLLNNNQFMVIRRLFTLYPELYSYADDILLSICHIPNEIRGIGMYRLLQGLLPELPFRKSNTTKDKSNNDSYDAQLIKCVSRYYQISKHEAESYIDMIYTLNKENQLVELLSMYGYDDKSIKNILKR